MQATTTVPRYLQDIVWPEKKKLLIYIAAPYSLGDVVANVRVACEIADTILGRGHIPFIPHLFHFWHFVSPKPWEEWMEIGKVNLERCDALLRVGGISIGADIEVEIAKERGIPIYYGINEIP